MRKLWILTLVSVLLLTGCNQKNDDSKSSISTNYNTTGKDVVEIKENLFIAKTNDIYINSEDYLGKVIKYEGIFGYSYLEETDTTYYYVTRYGPGCCADDGTAGFEVVWEDDYPKKNDWVEAIGILETYEEDGEEYLRLKLISLKVLEERGEEYVAS